MVLHVASSVCNSKRSRTVMNGQTISLLVAGTGVFSEYLARAGFKAPTLLNSVNYVLLVIVFGYRLYKIRSLNLNENEKQVPWYTFFLLAFMDVEGNFLAVTAYQYTDITSVMLLDCFTIPSVMVLSRIFLGTSYTKYHYIGVIVCLIGLIFTVLSDTLSAEARTGAPKAWLGDILCLLGSFCYAISNVGQEMLVKQNHQVDFLANIGFYGLFISITQVLLFERENVANFEMSWVIFGYMIGFIFCLFSLYVFTSMFLKTCDATILNLSLLTSDVWAVLAGVALFGKKLHGLYFLSFFLTILGVILYNLKPVPNKFKKSNDFVPEDGDENVPLEDDTDSISEANAVVVN